MIRTIFLGSSSRETDIFHEEGSSEEGCPARTNTPVFLNSMELYGAHEREVITISSVASLEPHVLTIESDPKEPTIPYGYGRQQLIIPLSFSDLKLPPNPFIVLNTIAVMQPNKEYSPQIMELSNPSPFSTPQSKWVSLKAGRHCTQLQMMPYFTQKTGLDEYIGTFFPVTPLTQTSPDQYSSFGAHPPYRRLRDDKRESWSWRRLFLKKGECRRTPTRHAASPY